MDLVQRAAFVFVEDGGEDGGGGVLELLFDLGDGSADHWFESIGAAVFVCTFVQKETLLSLGLDAAISLLIIVVARTDVPWPAGRGRGRDSDNVDSESLAIFLVRQSFPTIRPECIIKRRVQRGEIIGDSGDLPIVEERNVGRTGGCWIPFADSHFADGSVLCEVDAGFRSCCCKYRRGGS